MIEQLGLKSRGGGAAVRDDCFVRSNTAQGCVSFAAELRAGCPKTEERCVYLKSGYGGAAAALLDALQDRANDPQARSYWDAPGRERRCALCLPARGLCVIDAEAPFGLEPKLPGAGEEIFSLDCCRDNAMLRARREELAGLYAVWQRELTRAARFLCAARAMKRDMAFVASESLDFAKLERFASRFAARRLPQPNGHVGSETHGFITCITGQGLLLRRSLLASQYETIIVLEDEYGVAAPILWELVRGYALGNGLDVINCPCLLAPGETPEHLLLPQLGMACFTANKRHPIAFEGAQRIQAVRFLSKDALREHRCRLRFCRRTLRELLNEAYDAQAAAEQARAALDAAYAPALLPQAIASAAAQLLQGC